MYKDSGEKASPSFTKTDGFSIYKRVYYPLSAFPIGISAPVTCLLKSDDRNNSKLATSSG